ncbi:CBS domain-containing protein [Microtetraspora malaysiensis]|uniref:CBS domain-containing protein n=1 Tax=Microtetraspora malaysiensis TaxID=161358 RepID=UPI003D91C5E8
MKKDRYDTGRVTTGEESVRQDTGFEGQSERHSRFEGPGPVYSPEEAGATRDAGRIATHEKTHEKQKARDVMTPDPVVLPEDTPVVRAAKLMRDQAIGDVLVTRGDRLRGVVTDRDIVVRAVAETRDISATPIGALCSTHVVTVGPDQDADDVVRLMREKAIRRIPVVEKGHPIGIVSLGDLAVEWDPSSALSDICAAPPNE